MLEFKKGNLYIEENSCTCDKNIAFALEHELTCPVRSAYLMYRCEDIYTTEVLKTTFESFGYYPLSKIPNKEFSKKYEMMRCKSCNHWFPRWQFYRCPECNAGH